MKDFWKSFLFKNWSIFVTIIVSFSYTVLLDKDIGCSCKPQSMDCDVFMAVPFFIFCILQLWTNTSCQMSCKYLVRASSDCPQRFWGFQTVFILNVCKAALVGLLWVVSVLIDGDWFVCCKNNGSEAQAQLACKEKKHLTAVDIVTITEIKNHSRFIGFLLLLFIVLFASFMSLIGTTKHFDNSSYTTIILEEEEKVLEEALRTKKKEQLNEIMTKRIAAGQWTECFNISEELIKTEPTCRRTGYLSIQADRDLDELQEGGDSDV